MIEKDFVTEGLRRTKIDEYLEDELERAGYGGMDVQVTPLGTMVVVYAERPGMVIGRGGKTVRAITQTLKTRFELDNPQVEVKEVDVPELNPKIMAYKIVSMLQRGMHFRRVAYSTIRRIMGAGAQGVEVTISGKIRGSRSAVAKFVEGYIKKCGEPSTRFVKEGFATVQLKPGVLGIFVRIMPPDAVLPDKVDILPPTVESVKENEEVEQAEEETTTTTNTDVDSEILEEEAEIEEVELEELEDLEELEESEDVDESEVVEDVDESEVVEDVDVEDVDVEDVDESEVVEDVDVEDVDESEVVEDVDVEDVDESEVVEDVDVEDVDVEDVDESEEAEAEVDSSEEVPEETSEKEDD